MAATVWTGSCEWNVPGSSTEVRESLSRCITQLGGRVERSSPDGLRASLGSRFKFRVVGPLTQPVARQRHFASQSCSSPMIMEHEFSWSGLAIRATGTSGAHLGRSRRIAHVPKTS